MQKRRNMATKIINTNVQINLYRYYKNLQKTYNNYLCEQAYWGTRNYL